MKENKTYIIGGNDVIIHGHNSPQAFFAQNRHRVSTLLFTVSSEDGVCYVSGDELRRALNEANFEVVEKEVSQCL